MGDAHLRRRLTAVLMADVVGYSRLMGVDEEGTHRRLAGYVKDLLEPKITENHGRLIRTAGDGFLVEFNSAVDAVRCGLDVQRELAEHNADVPADRRIQLRIGVNAGDVIVENQDIYGNSVNIAARLEGLAEPGGVSVTRGVRDQLEGQPDLSFEDRGERWAKNIARPIRVYRVKYVEEQPRGFWHSLIAWPFPIARRFGSRATVLSTAILAAAVTLGALGLPAWRDEWRAAPRSSIIVMPFKNLSADASQDYFADAVTDDVTTGLSRLTDTIVIASATAFTYRGKAVDVRQIGQECGVRYLLEGSIQRRGTRVQTNARLIETASASQLWADHFEDEFTDIADLEDAITGRIASSLQVQLVKVESRRALATRPTDPDALDLRLHAMALLTFPITQAHHLVARRYLEDSLNLDPGSAEARALLAHILINDYLNNWLQPNETPAGLLQRAEKEVQEALDKDPSIAMAHQADGLVRRAKGHHQEALDAFDRAIYLDPNFSRAYAQKANQLVMVGRAQDAPPLVLKAIALSPRDPILGVFYWIIGRAYFVMENYNDAITWLRKSVEWTPDYWYSQAYLLAAYALAARLHEPEAVSTSTEYQRKFSKYTTRYISQLYATELPQPHIQASIQELYQGLRRAGVP